jgi:hypothetical protein
MSWQVVFLQRVRLPVLAHGDDGTAQAYCEAILSLAEIEEWTQSGREQIVEQGIAY